MANPLEGIAYVQQQGELGRQRGTQNRLAQLASQAFGAAPADQRGLVQQAIAADPSAGFALNTRLGDDRQARLGELSQKARLLVGYAKAGNRAGVDALYPQLAAEAQAIGLAQGIPTGWDDSYLPAMEQLAQLGGGVGNVVHSQRIGEDGYIYNTMRDGSLVNTGIKADRQMWLRDHPGMAPHLVGKGGEILPVGGQGPAPVPGSPQTPVPNGQQFVDDSVALANQLIAAGIPAEQVDAFLQSRLNPAQDAAQGVNLARPSEAQTAAATEAAKQAVQLQFAPAQAAVETQAAIERKAAESQVTQQADRQKQQAERNNAFAQYQAAIQGLRRSLPNTTTGPIIGRLPALTAEAQTAEGAVAALAPVLKQLFRAAGEGTFTDRDQQLLLDMVPTRTDLPAAREAKLQNIDNIVRAKLGQGGIYGGAPSDGPAAPQASNRVLRYNPATGDFE